jgi:rhamnosyltransferase
MVHACRPRVQVLLATHNSVAWLREQLETILRQEGVDVHVVASDDASVDGTPGLLAEYERAGRLTTLPAAPRALGSAHRNFMRLVLDAPIDEAEHVALADHDDIWLPGKLARAVERLGSTGAAGYSSNVIAFWPDGHRRLIDKAQPQCRHDHLFSSPGPGCTFVLPRASFVALRAWVAENREAVQQVSVHDWLIYAQVRGSGRRWLIDDEPTMLYRQHARNEIGANAGWRAAWRRVQRVRSGAYRQDVIAITRLVGGEATVLRALQRLSLGDRWWLIRHVHDFRRAPGERFVLALLFLLMPRGR